MSTPTPMSRTHNAPSSPTPSATSFASSFDMISPRSRSPPTSSHLREDSDDEIVWGDAESSSDDEDHRGNVVPSDDDFILLSHRTSPASTGLLTPSSSFTNTFADLQLSASSSPTKFVLHSKSQVEKTPKRVDPESAYPSPQTSPVSNRRMVAPSSTHLHPSTEATGLGSRSVVDDLSDRAETPSVNGEEPLGYEDASDYITAFLSNPLPKDPHTRLTLYQCLIVELGLQIAALPTSLKAAKALLKSSAFINIRDYLAVRTQGPDAVQSVLHKSKSALIKDLRKNHRNQVPRSLIKNSGLQVLLVTVFH